MQAKQSQFYPFHPFYEFYPYHSMFPNYHPIINYNPAYERYQLNEMKPVQFIPSAIDISYTSPYDFKLTSIHQARGKKNKIRLSNSKNHKHNKQNIFDGNIKVQRPTIIEQKQGRNANSNLLRMFFRRLHHKVWQNPKDIQRVIEKYQMQIKLQEFSEWLQSHKIDYRNYIRVPSVKKLFVENEIFNQHTKIMRILLKDFINKESINCYLTSRKVRRQVMTHNYHSIRFIFKDISAVKG